MRNAEDILSTLGKISKGDNEYVFKRVYRNLFNRDLFLRAYLKLAPHEGNMTKGVDGKTIDGFSMELVDDIIDDLRHERYNPQPAIRAYIPKKNGKLRPLGIPSFKDKLVQEALKEILEAIYEPTFSNNSHGFRPGRSCHTAIHEITYHFRGSVWAIEGDIRSFFDSIDHDVLLKILSRKIDDGRVIELIRRFLKAGYLDGGSFNESLLGCPQGSVISPILANIYLNELDGFMDGLKGEYDSKSKRRSKNSPYFAMWAKEKRALKKGEKELAETYRRQRWAMSCNDYSQEFIRVFYVRYCDDFCVFLAGSKKLAMEIKRRIGQFLSEELKLELSDEKTFITNLHDGKVRFLGFEIALIDHRGKFIQRKDGLKSRYPYGALTALVPQDAINKRISDISRNGKPYPRDDLLGRDVEYIINCFNSEIRGLYNYYCIASNVSRSLWKYRYAHYTCLQYTLAKKEDSKASRIRKKYGLEVPRADGHGTHHIIGLVKDGKKPLTYYNGGFKHYEPTYKQPTEEKEFGKELRSRIEAGCCEVCGIKGKTEVHHVRNLSELINRKIHKGQPIPDWLKLMESMRRRTLILCKSCHNKLHYGKLVIPKELLESRML